MVSVLSCGSLRAASQTLKGYLSAGFPTPVFLSVISVVFFFYVYKSLSVRIVTELYSHHHSVSTFSITPREVLHL
jgi:hypothetical protein